MSASLQIEYKSKDIIVKKIGRKNLNKIVEQNFVPIFY